MTSSTDAHSTTPPRAKRPHPWRRVRTLLLLVGIAVLAHIVRKIGVGTIWAELQRIGWWSLAIVTPSVCWYTLQALAWRTILRFRRAVPWAVLFRIKIAGEAVNAITPANFVGGDPVRVLLLRRHIPWTFGTAAVIIDRTIQSLATLFMVLCGMLLAFWSLPHLPLNIRYGLPMVLLVSSGFLAFVFVHQQRGIFSFGITLLKRLRIRRHFSTAVLARCEELDQLVAVFYREHPRAFWSALAAHWLGRCLGVVELYLIGHPLHPGFGWEAALLLGAIAPIVHMVFSFIPGAVGIMEGAFSGTLYLLKLPPSLGITIQIVKRLRAVLWLIVGVAVLSAHERHVVREKAGQQTS